MPRAGSVSRRGKPQKAADAPPLVKSRPSPLPHAEEGASEWDEWAEEAENVPKTAPVGFAPPLEMLAAAGKVVLGSSAALNRSGAKEEACSTPHP